MSIILRLGIVRGIGIFIFLLLVLTSLYYVNEGFAQIRDEIHTGSEKIHPTIAEWQSSTEPEIYAASRSLSFSDNKIAVYIHLDSKESISNLPNDVEVLSSDENIVLAFLSSSQIDQLAQLDFVERIAPPPMMATRQESSIPPRETIPSTSTKIHPTIAEWQSSEEPEIFAASRSLSFSDNKIAVYIHLDSKESISNLPNDVEVLSSDENIVLAFLSSSQIDQLAQLDFVERIAPPPITRNPPIPFQLDDNTTSMTLTITIAVVVAIAVAIFAIARTRKKKIV